MNASAPPISSNFARKLLRELRALDLLADAKPFVVAVSGGADSAALFVALVELKAAGKIKNKLVAAHFNHNLRGAESAADAEFVEKLAKRFECEFVCEIQNSKFKIQNLKGNLEQAARRARYDFLANAAAKYETNRVFVAHTLDDQAETVLMRLVRGSSAEGLAAMKPVTNYFAEQSAIIYRPLLGWARREMTENYCRARAIDFRTDAMNFDSRFARVRVRR